MMRSASHHDAILTAMRTTVTLDDDVAAEVERLRREDGLGVSAAVNRLARTGAARPREQRPYVHRTFAMGLKVDVTNIGEVEALLDELDRG